MKKLQKIFILGFISLFAMMNISLASAETNSSVGATNAGVQTPVGVQGQVGVRGPVGAQGEVGTQGQVGAANTGAQAASVDNNSPALPAGGSNNSSTSSNSQTGAGSQNTNTTNAGATTDTTQNNNSNINNNVGAALNTGNINVGQNSVAGNVTSGDISGAVNLVNVSNSQFAPGSTIGSQLIDGTSTNQINLLPSSDPMSLSNAETGSNSQNLNTVNNPDIISILNNNNSTTNNGVVIDANTGTNNLSSNTYARNLTTGNINLGINFLNLANLIMPNTLLSVDLWNVLGPFNGQIVIPDVSNTLTGTDSSNANLLTSTNSTGVNVVQNSSASNGINVNANTGDNTVGGNTVFGGESTGATSIRGAISTIANLAATPVLYLINVFGHWSGSLLGLNPNQVIVNQINDSSGNGSINQNTADASGQTNIDLNNNATVANQITVNANTGRNTIQNNTAVGRLATGSINISTNVINVLNALSTQTGHIILRIINIFGDWNGNAVPTPTNTPPTPSSSTATTNSSTVISSGLTSDPSSASTTSIISTRKLSVGRKLVKGVAGVLGISQAQMPMAQQASDPIVSSSPHPFPWKVVMGVFLLVLAGGWIALETLTFGKKAKI